MLAASRDDAGPTRDASFGHDSSRPSAMDLVHLRRQARAASRRVGPTRHHLPHALAAPSCARGGPRGRFPQGLVCGGGAQVSVPAVIVLVVLRFSWIAWVAVALGLLLALWYSITYINLTADERLVRHGYLPGTLQQVLDERKPARMSSMSR